MKNKLAELGRRVVALFRRGQLDADLEEEMRLHQELREQEQVERGVSSGEARYAAQRRLGDSLLLREESRDMWGWNWLETLVQDLRYGLRQLRRNPGFTAVAIITLALGIGANTAIFSVVDAALLKPLPYRAPGRLVVAWNQLRRLGLNEFPASLADYYDYKSSTKVFEDIAAFQPAFLDLTGGGQPERVYRMRTSANLFPLLGISAERGRTFTDEENQPGRGNVILLSDALWRSRFGSALAPSPSGETAADLLARRNAIQSPYASAASASGFLLVSLSKMSRPPGCRPNPTIFPLGRDISDQG